MLHYKKGLIFKKDKHIEAVDVSRKQRSVCEIVSFDRWQYDKGKAELTFLPLQNGHPLSRLPVNSPNIW